MDGESNPSSINCHCFIWRDFSCPNDEREASSILTVTVACLREDIIIWTLIQRWVTNDNYQIHLDLGLYHKERHIREREREKPIKVLPGRSEGRDTLASDQPSMNLTHDNPVKMPLTPMFLVFHLYSISSQLGYLHPIFSQKSTLPNSKRTIPLRLVW